VCGRGEAQARVEGPGDVCSAARAVDERIPYVQHTIVIGVLTGMSFAAAGPLPPLVVTLADELLGQTGFVEDRNQGWSAPVVLAQACEVLGELVVQLGGLGCGLRALEDPRGGAVGAAVGAL